LLVPILEHDYRDTLVAGEIELRFLAHEGTFDFWYRDNRLPLNPRDYPKILSRFVLDGPVEIALGHLADAVLAAGDVASTRQIAVTVKKALAEAAGSEKLTAAITEGLEPYRGRPGDAETYVPLHALLETQAYRIAHWRSAADDINYRRFFDIGDLAGIGMDKIDVFRDAHALLGRLLSEGRIQGLRIDHVDGLADPGRYCRRLHRFATMIASRAYEGSRLRPYIVIEKILASDETLRDSWPVAGTTGYEYLALVNGLFVDPTGYARLRRDWVRFTGMNDDLDSEIYRCRRLIMDHSLASELTSLVHWLCEIAEADWGTRDFTRKRLRDALTEIVASFTVYRTYVTPRGADSGDRQRIAKAIQEARARWNDADDQILEFVGSLLTYDITTANPVHYANSGAVIDRFVTRFQQYTGAIAAKAIEDTLFYRYIPLSSVNEVGASFRAPTTSIESLHAQGAVRAAQWPQALLASATHDTKRGEDTRARMDALSEMPDEWARRVARWHIYNRAHREVLDGAPAPTLNDEYLLYQTIVGTWPMRIGMLARSASERSRYVERLKAYMVKASREAKLSTSWSRPETSYEQALSNFVDAIFASADGPFMRSVMRFLPPLLRMGAINSLTQLVLKMTFPGIPDFYQGTEFWDLSLVDPDNRGAVDFSARVRVLDTMPSTDFIAAREAWRDGRLKLFLLHRILALRNRHPELFRHGTYRPLTVAGPDGQHVIAFARAWQDREIVVVVSRLLARKLRGDPASLWPDAHWLGETRIEGIDSRGWTDALSGAEIRSCSSGLAAANALAVLPVAVLQSD
jgi:malto-oligosyltrehalose synthase